MKQKDMMRKLKKSLHVTNNDLKRKHLPKMNRYRKELLYKSFTAYINRYFEHDRKIFYDCKHEYGCNSICHCDNCVHYIKK